MGDPKSLLEMHHEIVSEWCGAWIAKWIAEQYPDLKGSQSLFGIEYPNIFEAFAAGWNSYAEWNRSTDRKMRGRPVITGGEFFKRESEKWERRHRALKEYCLGRGLTYEEIEEGSKIDESL